MCQDFFVIFPSEGIDDCEINSTRKQERRNEMQDTTDIAGIGIGGDGPGTDVQDHFVM